MNFIIRRLIKLGILKKDLEYHFLRSLIVIICLCFGYQKWFDYEAQALIPYISRGPLIFLVVPRLRHSWSNLLSWRLGMAIRSTVAPRTIVSPAPRGLPVRSPTWSPSPHPPEP